MKEWFMTDPLRSALLCVAVPATVIMILQTVMIFIGMAGHSDVDIQIMALTAYSATILPIPPTFI